MTKLKEIALSYAKRGWAVLPLHTPQERLCSCLNLECSSPGKHPRISGGLKKASNNHDTVENWWKRWPSANIGIATGAISGFFVVDIDEPHAGVASWKAWTKGHDVLAQIIAKTGAGYHFFYKFPDTGAKCRTGVLPGIDIRGDGGYIVAPGSTHVNGNTYAWSKWASDPALPPNRVLELLKKPTSTVSQSLSKVDNTQTISPGSRNCLLAKIAGLLQREGTTPEVLRRSLDAINNSVFSPPLAQDEVKKIGQSISRYQSVWKAPKPIKQKEHGLPEFDLTCCPDTLKNWILDAAERMQVPCEFLAAPCLVSLASVIGSQLTIFPKQEDSWEVTPNLWGAIIARPGQFKSPAIHEATSFIRRLANDAHHDFEAQKITQEARSEGTKSRLEGIKEAIKKAASKNADQQTIETLEKSYADCRAKLEANPFVQRRFIVNDTTVEKLGVILKENPNGLFLLRDELAGWAVSLKKREGDRELYLEGWDGKGSYTVDRIGRGTTFIPNLCLSLFGGIQPSKLYTLNCGKAGSDGLLQRFQILVYPEIKGKWKNVDRKPNKQTYEQLLTIFQKATCLKDHIKEDAKYGLRFHPDAQRIFNNWREDLEGKLRRQSLSEDLESHLSKYRSLVPSIALIVEIISCISKQQKIMCIHQESLDMALKWVEFLEAHARKVYAEEASKEALGMWQLSRKILGKSVNDYDSIRSIYRHKWPGLHNSEEVQNAISLLADYSWATTETIKNGPGQSIVIRINPEVCSLHGQKQ